MIGKMIRAGGVRAAADAARTAEAKTTRRAGDRGAGMTKRSAREVADINRRSGSDPDGRPQNSVEQARKALVQLLAAKPVEPQMAFGARLDHAGLAQDLEVVRERRI